MKDLDEAAEESAISKRQWATGPREETRPPHFDRPRDGTSRRTTDAHDRRRRGAHDNDNGSSIVCLNNRMRGKQPAQQEIPASRKLYQTGQHNRPTPG